MNRVILVMLTLAMGMQGMILYRQHATSTTKRTLAEAPVRVPLEPTKLELKGLPTKGGPSASVAIVEFSDYECPFCERHATQVGPEIEKKIVSLGKVRMFFVNNPLPNHNNAKMLAAASICAGNQGHFWEMHAALFAKKPRNLSDVTSYAQEFGLDRNKFQGCLDDP